MTEYRELKQAIIDTCLQLEAIGFVIGTYGNASARVPGGLIVTPSRVDYHSITPDDMVTVADDGHVLDGHRLPSSETDVHRLIYLARSDVGAVLHTHSFYATALSCRHETVPVIVEEQSQVVGDAIRCAPYVPAGQHEKLDHAVADTIGASNGVMLANHGVVACGRNVDESLFVAQIIERVCQMYLMARAISECSRADTARIHPQRA